MEPFRPKLDLSVPTTTNVTLTLGGTPFVLPPKKSWWTTTPGKLVTKILTNVMKGQISDEQMAEYYEDPFGNGGR